MKRLFWISLLACGISAQTLTFTGPATAAPGQSISLSLNLTGNLTGPDPAAIAGLQWQLQLPTGSTASAVPNPAIPSKTLSCTGDYVTCLFYGQNVTPIPYGLVASYTITIPATATGSLTIGLTDLVAASAAGTAIPISVAMPYTVRTSDRRDLNNDGKVDALDVNLMAIEVLAAATNPAACTDDQNADGTCNLLDVFLVLVKAMALAP